MIFVFCVDFIVMLKSTGEEYPTAATQGMQAEEQQHQLQPTVAKGQPSALKAITALGSACIGCIIHINRPAYWYTIPIPLVSCRIIRIAM